MILIFDLDDTLYDEMSYVTSGLRAVANYGMEALGWDANESLAFMKNHLRLYGRGKIFDEWLQAKRAFTKTRVNECVRLYRHHYPEITLFPFTPKVLDYYLDRLPMYLVTDGHKVVQQKKIDALGVAPKFKQTFITHRYGIRNAKPSLHCFDIIRRKEKCEWSQMTYVGDNPTKDFVGLNRVGALTVRVRTGCHSERTVGPGYDASVSIPNLGALPGLLSSVRNSK